MNPARNRSEPMYRLWIATYADWRPNHWNESPPRATALEPVDDGLYSADEAALFLEGFNGSMLQHDKHDKAAAVWAVAIPVAIRYEGDAQPGMIVRGYVFDIEHAGMSRAATSPRATGVLGGAPPGDQVHGFDQSPQRSR